MAQLVKNPPAMWESWVRSLGWGDPLEKGKATHSSILAWRIPWTVHGVSKSQTRLATFTLLHFQVMLSAGGCTAPFFCSQPLPLLPKVAIGFFGFFVYFF